MNAPMRDRTDLHSMKQRPMQLMETRSEGPHSVPSACWLRMQWRHVSLGGVHTRGRWQNMRITFVRSDHGSENEYLKTETEALVMRGGDLSDYLTARHRKT